MADRILYASGIDYVRTLNDNMVDNALGRRSAFLLVPSLYQRAYAVVYETGEVPVTENIVAPDEEVAMTKQTRVNIFNGR